MVFEKGEKNIAKRLEVRKKISKSKKIAWKDPKSKYRTVVVNILTKKRFTMLGKHHSKKTKEKMRLAQLGNKNHMYGKNLSKEHKQKVSKALKGNKNNIYRKKGIITSTVFTKEKWKNKNFKEKQLNAIFKGLKIKPNKPEKIMIEIIKENNLPFNYVGDGSIWFRGETKSFNPDFLSKNPKYIIELFGDYWHNREDMKKRDKERLRTYKKYGYKTLIIWEHELQNPNQIINKIKKMRKI